MVAVGLWSRSFLRWLWSASAVLSFTATAVHLFNQSAQEVLHQESFHELLQSQSHSLETQGLYGNLVQRAIGQNTHL